MTNKPDKLQTLNEQELDCLLEQDAGTLSLTKEAVPHITDWPQIEDQLFWGLMLNLVTLNFLNLQYIFPTCGLVLLFLGLRELRRENRWLQLAWFATIAALICAAIQLTAQGTIHAAQLIDAVSLMGTLAEALYTVTLLLGLAEMRKNAGLQPWTRALKTVGVLYLLWIPLVLFLQNHSSTLLALPVFLILISCLFSSLRMTLNQMQEIGYTARIAPKRLKDLPTGLLMLALLLIAVLCSTHFGQSYPMEWKPIESYMDLSAEDLARLEQQGIYEDDLAAMDSITRMLLKNAETIHVERFGTKHSSWYSALIAAKTDPDSKDWHAIYLFHWDEKDLSQGNAAFSISTKTSQHTAFRYDMPIYGGLYYEKDGQTYYSDYHKLEYTMVDQVSFFGGSRDLRIRGNFTPPEEQDRYSGFVRFTVTAPQDIVTLTFEALFRKDKPLYPAYSAEDILETTTSDHFYRRIGWAVFE